VNTDTPYSPKTSTLPQFPFWGYWGFVGFRGFVTTGTKTANAIKLNFDNKPLKRK